MNQQEWDRLLIESFYVRPDFYMYRIIGATVGLEDGAVHESVKGLMRTPGSYQYGITVAAFVCNYLPKLAEILWRRSKKDIDLIAKVVSKSKLDTAKVHAQQVTRRHRKQQSVREHDRYCRTMMLASEIAMVNDKAGGHNWSTVK